jgi:hypothetical protein
MTIKRIPIFIFLIIVFFGCVACAGYPQYQPTNSLSGDEPNLSSAEAIGLARQHSLSSNISPVEERAAEQVRRLETGLNHGITWEASYRGGGKWTVILHVPSTATEDGLDYRWTVLENNTSVIFIEEVKVRPNISLK